MANTYLCKAEASRDLDFVLSNDLVKLSNLAKSNFLEEAELRPNIPRTKLEYTLHFLEITNIGLCISG